MTGSEKLAATIFGIMVGLTVFNAPPGIVIPFIMIFLLTAVIK